MLVVWGKTPPKNKTVQLFFRAISRYFVTYILQHTLTCCLETYLFRNDELEELGSFLEYFCTGAASRQHTNPPKSAKKIVKTTFINTKTNLQKILLTNNTLFSQKFRSMSFEIFFKWDSFKEARRVKICLNM